MRSMQSWIELLTQLPCAFRDFAIFVSSVTGNVGARVRRTRTVLEVIVKLDSRTTPAQFFF